MVSVNYISYLFPNKRNHVMARRKIETPTVTGSIVIDLSSGKALEKALPAVIYSRIRFFREKLMWRHI